MATAFNTTVKLYTSVPLVKGGTEVLYLSAGAAEGVLSAFLSATYTAYYFERENRRYIQIDDVFGNLDSVNYISFANNSHGGKIYFAFVDQVVYVNDHNTQIEFTIDPFPTFLGDTKEAPFVYVRRNTPDLDDRTSFMIGDYVPPSIAKKYTTIVHRGYRVTGGVVYFACNAPYNYVGLGDTGLCVEKLTGPIVESIKDHGGIIIGGYMDIHNGIINAYFDLTIHIEDITFNPLDPTSSQKWKKVNTGLYNDLLVVTSNGAKQYSIEDFLTPTNVTFSVMVLHMPSPMYYVYPKNYRGVVENVAEGIAVKVPSIPITANATYTDAQFASDARGVLGGIITGAAAGYVKGGGYGAIAGGVIGGLGGAANMAVNAYMTEFKAPTVIGRGEPALTFNNEIVIDFVNVSPSDMSRAALKNYFDYYGYCVERVSSLAAINLDDEAFLQVSGDFLFGSEADDELNARLNQGIKIRKTLSSM